MCGIRSKIKNDWLDGIFPQEPMKLQPINKIKILKKPLRDRHEVFIVDPYDTKVLKRKKEILQRNLKYLLEDLIRFYIRKCIYTPLLYMAVMTVVSHYISGFLCLLFSLIVCTVTVVLHYVYIIIYLDEDEDEDEDEE